MPEASFEAVVCTEVLEHVLRPGKVLEEFVRVLAPGGRLCLTVPFAWPLHEEPFDFYRYTKYSLSDLLESAGFVAIAIDPRSGYFTTLAQLAEMERWLTRSDTVSGRVRASWVLVRACASVIRWLIQRVPELDSAATGVSMPLGYIVSASKPEPVGGQAR